jgi:hypothetical protein
MLVALTMLVFSSGCALVQTALAVGVAYGISKATK